MIGVWESNEPARQAIEREFGLDALRDVEARLDRVCLARKGPNGVRSQASAHEKDGDRRITDSCARSSSEPCCDLQFAVDPTWGVQRLFHRYQTALTAFATKSLTSDVGALRFRRANAAVEARLRIALPDRMKELDAIYPLDKEPRTLASGRIPDEKVRGNPVMGRCDEGAAHQ
jgi:hypothetical protein